MNKRAIIKYLFVIVLFSLGVTVFLYPAASGYINDQSQTRVVENYEEAILALSEEEKAALLEAAQAYNEALSQTRVIISDPFGTISQRGQQQDVTASFLTVGEVMATIQIPKIGIKLPIYEGTTEEVLQKGIGWLQGTSLPVGGSSTHSVLTGHRGLPTSKLFTDLDKLEVSDEFFVRNSSEILAYQVRDIQIIEPEDVGVLGIVEGEDRTTLLTCHPYIINSQRLLVLGERIPYTGQLDDLLDEANPLTLLSVAEKDLIHAGVIVAFLGLLLVLFVWKPWHRRSIRKGVKRND